MTAYIDGDILLYKAGFACEYRSFLVFDSEDKLLYEGSTRKDASSFAAEYPEETRIEVRQNLYDNVDPALLLSSILNKITTNLQTEDIHIYLTNKDINKNFRYKADPEYKQNRKGMLKPLMYDTTRDILLTKYNAEEVEGIEADDALGKKGKEEGAIICSIDKDLLQVPGTHYNIDSGEIINVTNPGSLFLDIHVQNNGKKLRKISGYGERWFWAQMLLGDRVDNIPGIKGYGDVKVYNTLSEVSITKISKVVLKIYEDNLPSNLFKKRFTLNKKLLRILK